jgi:deazaflavin-dependent oxidoreductase (nitroreductase family)
MSRRTSGRPYATHVGAVATDEGFVIALVYGSETDWLKNVLASGSATIVHEGSTYRVDEPEVVPIGTAAAYLAVNDRRNHRMFGVDQCLRVRRAEPDEPGEPFTDPR